MVKAIRQRVTVGPGGSIELRRSDLPAGKTAEIIVLLDEDLQEGTAIPPMSSFFGTAKGTYGSTPEEADRYLRELRDEWER